MKTINNAQLIGTLKEMNLKIEEKEVTLRGQNGVEKKVTCRQIGKADFKNPTFTVSVRKEDEDGNVTVQDLGAHFFPIAEKKLDENNNIIENPRFKSLETVMNTYVCGETRVKIDGTLVENGYVGQDNKWKSVTQMNGFQITSTNVSDEDSSDSEISGVITNIVPEVFVKDEVDNATGRLKVSLACFNNAEEYYPVTFVVESDIADDFEQFYEIGQTVKIYYEMTTKTIGTTAKSTTGGFGRRDTKRQSGFSINEFSIFRGDAPFEEDSEYFISVDKTQEAKKVYELNIEKKIAEKSEGGDAKTSSPKGASKGGSSPFGGATKTTTSAPKKNPFA